MNPINKLARSFSAKSRKARAKIFREMFSLDSNTKILDLGSEHGRNINAVLADTEVRSENVYIADISQDAVNQGAREFGYNPVFIDESGTLPFTESFFDIVYCSSVIEHVTITKDEVWQLRSGKDFQRRSLDRQSGFANEIKRLGRQYYVQTPYRHFPIESHTWLPFIAWLPRRILVPLLKLTNQFWVKKTSPDWYLLNKSEMKQLFSEAEIVTEYRLGLPKSLIAVRSDTVDWSVDRQF